MSLDDQEDTSHLEELRREARDEFGLLPEQYMHLDEEELGGLLYSYENRTEDIDTMNDEEDIGNLDEEDLPEDFEDSELPDVFSDDEDEDV